MSRSACFLLLVALILGCASGTTAGDAGDEESPAVDVAEVAAPQDVAIDDAPGQPDPAPEAEAVDLPPADEGVAVDEGVGSGLDVIPEVAGDADAAEVGTSICPCNSIYQPVCGLDNKTTYDNLDCARCAVCNDCDGCPPDNPIACGPGTSEFMLFKGACCCCECDNAEKCAAINYPQCGAVCGYAATPTWIPESTFTTYPSVCDLIHAFGCGGWQDDSWSKLIVAYGPCPGDDPCVPCAGQPTDPVCGNDDKTYASVCTLKNCPKTVGVEVQYLGACIPTTCSQCTAQPKVEVCANEEATSAGTTYANACAAKCAGIADSKVRAGKCCPECDVGPAACGADGKLYLSQCHLTQCLGKDPCPDNGVDTCGNDGTTYQGTCLAQCYGGGVLHAGACIGLCEQCGSDPTQEPVCGANGETYENACFAACMGAAVAHAGPCA